MRTGVIDVVIPAGGAVGPDYEREAGTSVRALVPIGPDRQPALQYVVDALRTSGRAGKIIVIGHESLVSQIRGVDQFLQEAGDIAGGATNVLSAFANVSVDRPVLVCASDLPFLNAEAIADFLDRANDDSEITAALVLAGRYLAAYPDAPESEFVSLVETGPVAMGGVFRVVPGALLANQTRLRAAFLARKSQWRMAILLGPCLTWQFARKRVSLAAVQARVGRILGCRVDVVVDCFPELANDIDTIEDYQYASTRAGR
ncbi:MAG: NTP transferase domain-containing protein [Capsulimonadaceae bacterium]